MDQEFVDRLNTVIQIVGGPKRFSVLTEYSLSSVNKWKSGESEPTREKLPVMAKVVGVNVGWLVSGDEDDESYGIERALKRLAAGEDAENESPLFAHLAEVAETSNRVQGKTSVPVLIYSDIASMLEEKNPLDIMHLPSESDEGHDVRAFVVKRSNKNPMFEGGDVLVVDLNADVVEDYDVCILQIQDSATIEQIRTTQSGIETVGRIPPRSLNKGEYKVAGKVIGSYRPM